VSSRWRASSGEKDDGSPDQQQRPDEVWSEGNLDTTGPSFPEIIAEVSRTEEVVPGEVYGSAAFGFGYRVDPGRALHRGTVVELEADGIGILRNRVSDRVR
jgi:2-keto-4-pentenoate hydratase/2-oxohepta-3-ene-1,7-dioic acid hydratase in catechol pathway